MRRYEIVGLFSRRLDLKAGRVQAILGKLQEAGVVSGTDNKRYPENLSEREIVSLFVAVLGESGISSAGATANTFGALRSADGLVLSDVLEAALFRQSFWLDQLVVRQEPPGVSCVINGAHTVFGAQPPEQGATRARMASGSTMAAIAAELSGSTPQQADAAAAILKLRGANA